MYTDSKTGQLLPILVGTKMIDPAGSGQEVPILGAATDKKTGNTVPLGGTMEDPEGGGMYLFIILTVYMFVFDGMSFVSNFWPNGEKSKYSRILGILHKLFSRKYFSLLTIIHTQISSWVNVYSKTRVDDMVGGQGHK